MQLSNGRQTKVTVTATAVVDEWAEHTPRREDGRSAELKREQNGIIFQVGLSTAAPHTPYSIAILATILAATQHEHERCRVL